MNGFDLSTVSGIYMGSGDITALYLGSSLIWPTNYETEYLTITSMNNDNYGRYNDVIFKASDVSVIRQIEVSYDKNTWEAFTSSVEGTIIGSLKKGNKLYIRGYNNCYSEGKDYYNQIMMDSPFYASGNIMSLIDGDNFNNIDTLTEPFAFASLFSGSYLIDTSNLYLPATTLSAYCYYNMFYSCTWLMNSPKELPATTLAVSCYEGMFSWCEYLVSIPQILPATTLADYCYSSMFMYCYEIETAPELPATTLADYCYDSMFWSCQKLKKAPVLPATTLTEGCYRAMFGYCILFTSTPTLPATILAESCYESMFEICTSLKYASALPATTLAKKCYYSMFEDCTSLKTSPSLLADTLATECYGYMFRRCTSLNTIIMLATDDQIYTKNALNNWVADVAPTGTFIKSQSQSTIRLNNDSGVPTGWSVESRYGITVINSVGGTLVPNRYYGKQYDTVYLNRYPDEGYDIGTITVTDSNGNNIPLTGYTFSMPASNVTVTSTWIGYLDMYLTIESLDDSNEFYWKSIDSQSTGLTLRYSYDKTSWSEVTSSVNGTFFARISKGNRIYVDYASYNCYFTSTGDFRVLGCISQSSTDYMFYNCTHLLDVSNLYFADTEYGTFSNKHMFEGCTSIVNPPNLTHRYAMGTAHGFESMFEGCTSLTTAPDFNLDRAGLGTCYRMFYGCTSLTTPPVISVNELYANCFESMFEGCTSLTTAPDLPFRYLKNYCYKRMFYNCSSLNSIKMLAIDLANNSLDSWVHNVAPTGTFYKAPEMTSLTVGDNGIPTGWVSSDYISDYTVSLSQTTHGTATSNLRYANEGDLVKITMTPDSGYEVDTYSVVDGSGNPVSITLSGPNIFGFYMPASNVVASVTFDTISYTISVSSTTHGTVTSNKNKAHAGDFVTLTVTPDYEYELDTLTVLDANNNPITVHYPVCYFVMPASNVTVSATFYYTYVRQYLTIQSLADNNTISWFITGDYGSNRPVQVSTDLENWTTIAATTSGATLATLDTGDLLYIKGNTYGGHPVYTYFSTTGNFNIYGNIMSLVWGDSIFTITIDTFSISYSSYLFEYLFRNCTHLINAANLMLPATIIYNSEKCYQGMFSGCTSLTTAPQLPATSLELSDYCYNSMFFRCTSLTTAPELPATTLTNGCYNNMFYGCTSLTTAPELPAITLTSGCYTYMFYNCSSLNYIKMLATDISASSCLTGWVHGVAASGIFIKDDYMTDLTVGDNGIPTGWTVQDNYGSQYLTIESMSDNNKIYWTTSGNGRYIQYSTDKINWTSAISQAVPVTILTTLNTGDKLYLKGSFNSELNHSSFKSTNNFKVYGNIMSLVYGDNFVGQTTLTYIGQLTLLLYNCYYLIDASNLILPATTLSTACYSSMFSNDESLISAPKVLPATTLSNQCYESMFQGCTSLINVPKINATTVDYRSCYRMFKDCTSLVTAPELHATTITDMSCYEGMFEGCTSLVNAPSILPATTLNDNCYKSMFYGCTSLTTAPELPATTLVDGCYRYMFQGCSSLNSITMLATDISASACLGNWVSNVAGTGTFYKNSVMTTLPTGDSGIPTGWTVNDIYVTYSITIGQTTNGTVTSNVQNAEVGDTITLTVTPDSGYLLDTLTVLDASSNPVTVTNNQFTMPASNVTVSAIFALPYDQQYLTIESLEDNNDIGWKSTNSTTKTIQCSTDMTNWTSVTSSTTGELLATLNTGDKLYLKGTNNAYGATWSTNNFFTSNKTFNVYGNIKSLIYGDNFVTSNFPSDNAVFYCMFKESLVINASNLILPTQVNYAIYSGMFQNCTYLTSAPELPGTTTAAQCYNGMFKYCTSLTTAPVLYAATVNVNSYKDIFLGCTSLNYIECYATNISATGSLTNWVSGVAASGTFTKLASMTSFPTGNNGIPSGWTVVDK